MTKPTEGKVGAKIGALPAMRSWFKANPGEHLNYDDLMSRFGFKTRAGAKQAVYMLKMEGLVRSDFMIVSDPERPR